MMNPFSWCRYCVVFDPLDGSSNIDCGVSIGTVIFLPLIALSSIISVVEVVQLQHVLSGDLFWLIA